MVPEWPLGQNGHYYFHLAGILPRVLHEEVDYNHQKYSAEDLIGEKQQALTRAAAVFAVGGLATRVPSQVKKYTSQAPRQAVGKQGVPPST